MIVQQGGKLNEAAVNDTQALTVPDIVIQVAPSAIFVPTMLKDFGQILHGRDYI